MNGSKDKLKQKFLKIRKPRTYHIHVQFDDIASSW